MRLIDADAFGNRLYHEVFEKDSEDQRWDSGCWMRYRLFEKVLREQPTVEQPEQQWIPCSERLPSKADHTDDMVLVCYRNGSVRFNTYMNGWVQGNPVAWMPLPEPYGEEDHETD